MENYEYIGDLGSGSYGFVWKCQQRSSGRIVAVKGFKLAHTDKKFLDQAIREVRMLRASCDHPNVVQLLEAFRSSSGRVYMVFEYVERCLSSELHKRFTCGLPAAQTRLVLWQLLCAVAHLHSKKIIHRDIKPGNLLMTADGVLKLCDFGFARTTRGEPYQPDRFSSYVVTRWYRSPEMLVSDLYSAASDVWSLGCTFAEIATGRPLFPGTSSLDQLWRIMRCLGSLPPSQAERFAAAATAAGLPEPPPPPPRGKSLWQRLPELEGALLDVVQACLRLDPAKRPTAAQLLQMPYFSEVPRLLAGSPLEKLYGEYGTAASQRPRTTSGRNGLTAAAGANGTNGTIAAVAPVAAQQPPQQQHHQHATASASAAASRGVAVKVMTSEELVREATGGKVPASASVGDGRGSRRPTTVSLSAVAASLLGELPAPPGGSSSVQLVPLLALPAAAAPPPPPPLPGLDGTGPWAAAAAPPPPPPPLTTRSSGTSKTLPAAPSSSSSSSKKSLGVCVGANGLMGQPSPPTLSPRPPSGSRPRSGAASRSSLPPLTQQHSGRMRLVATATVPTAPPTAAATPRAALQPVTSDVGVSEHPAPRDVDRAADRAADRARSSTCEGSMERPAGRPVTGKRLAASQDVPMAFDSGGGAAAAAAAGATAAASTARAVVGGSRIPLEAESPQVNGRDDMLTSARGSVASDPRVGLGDGGERVGSNLGLVPDGGGDDDVLSDGDGHASDDDELMEYFAAKPAGGGGLAAAVKPGDGASRRALTVPSTVTGATVPVPSSSAAASGGGGAAAAASASGGGAAAGGGGGGGASMRRPPTDGVQGAHHGLYGSRQANGVGAGGASASLNGVLPTNRRVAAMVMRTADISSGGGGGAAPPAAAAGGGDAGSPRQVPCLKLPKRATVGSYLTVAPSAAAAPGEPSPPPPPPQAAAAAATVVAAAAARPRTAGVGGGAVTEAGLYRGLVGAGAAGVVAAHLASHGALPALHPANNPHALTTTTGTGLAPASSMPYTTANYGRSSTPMGGYVVTGASANVAGSGRRRALSRQGSVVFNQLMYDALPEIGTPGGAPEVPAGTPPRRRIVMSGLTPCRTAAARAAAEGIPPAAAMAAVLGETLHSTTEVSVAYSPIHVGRSVDLLSPDRDSGSNGDTAAVATGGGAAVRRPHRRQASLASLTEPPGGGNAAAAAAVASAAGYHTYRFAADQPAAAASGGGGGDAGMVFGSSAPTVYHHRSGGVPHVRPVEPGAAAGPVAIVGGVSGRVPMALGSAGAGGGGAGGSPASLGTLGPAHATPPSGSRGFTQPSLTPAARSRLAIGPLMRDVDAESQSPELDPLGTWGGASCSPAGGPVAGGQELQPQQYPLLQSAAAAAAATGGGGGGGPHGHPGLPLAMRARVGRWASGLIDSLPEDREVLHVAYGDWPGSNFGEGSTEVAGGGGGGGGGGGDGAIQMLAPIGSGDWAGGGSGPRSTVTSPPPRTGASGPWPPSADRRAVTSSSAVAAAGTPQPYLKSSPGSFPRSPSPSLHPGGSPRMPSGRSRRNLQIATAGGFAAAAAGGQDGGAAAGAGLNRASSCDSLRDGSLALTQASTAAAGSRMRQHDATLTAAAAAAAEPLDDDASYPAGSRGGGGTRSGSGKKDGKWPRAKAFLGGRLISSLVRKLKEQTSAWEK
ncbi:hypothetical protein PLESTB_001012600 [Pleodorina starrii]|uniref:cyclin-dependent kinase n=1 Tax=Pleodorina starrii TaxID=330485 RepID=A0A9W6BP22_9CHLO|nr:hypothetical protein PLESTB_001012600 [Pleodorina starrii]